MIEKNGPLDDLLVGLDRVTISYYQPGEAGAGAHEIGRIRSVTRYVGTTLQNMPLTTTYSAYDLFGVPHRVTDPNGHEVTYSPSVDRLTWTISETGIAGVSTVQLNPDGSTRSTGAHQKSSRMRHSTSQTHIRIKILYLARIRPARSSRARQILAYFWINTISSSP